jgi:short-subunit dehydrogenase|tara:strand:+ start:1254 stop:2054 length:801 start_codon:yes stop_codon:yes gene_type:complete
MNLSGKVCVITGASSGIGKSLSIKLASKGASVVLAARRNSKLESITNEIKQTGGNAFGIKTDITKSIECKNLIDESIDRYGKIDILLLGAGVSMWTPFEDISDISFFKDLMDTNYTGAVHCIHAALPHLISSKGMIVTCSTAQAIVGFTNHSGYAASKHALHGFLDTLDMELDGKVKFLEAFLGWIRGTSMRSNAFGPNGKKMGETKRKHSKNSIELGDCTDRIIQAIIDNKKTVYIPWNLRLIPLLDLFMSKYLRKKITKAVQSE